MARNRRGSALVCGRREGGTGPAGLRSRRNRPRGPWSLIAWMAEPMPFSRGPARQRLEGAEGEKLAGLGHPVGEERGAGDFNHRPVLVVQLSELQIRDCFLWLEVWGGLFLPVKGYFASKNRDWRCGWVRAEKEIYCGQSAAIAAAASKPLFTQSPIPMPR